MTSRALARLALALSALAMILAAAACGGTDEASADEALSVEELQTSFVPVELVGLEVEQEPVGELLDGIRRPYVDGASLYSLRNEDDALQATLQVVRFRDDAPHEDEEFQRSIIQRIGSAAPRLFHVAGQPVYLTVGRRQQLALWFRDQHLFVVAVRDEYPAPRALIREALEVHP